MDAGISAHPVYSIIIEECSQLEFYDTNYLTDFTHAV